MRVLCRISMLSLQKPVGSKERTLLSIRKEFSPALCEESMFFQRAASRRQCSRAAGTPIGGSRVGPERDRRRPSQLQPGINESESGEEQQMCEAGARRRRVWSPADRFGRGTCQRRPPRQHLPLAHGSTHSPERVSLLAPGPRHDGGATRCTAQPAAPPAASGDASGVKVGMERGGVPSWLLLEVFWDSPAANRAAAPSA